MNKTFSKLMISAAVLLFSATSASFGQSLKEQLSALPQVKAVEKLESDYYKEKYLIRFEQPVDHKHPELGRFTQRVFVCNVHPDSATVLVTEGYGAQHAMSKGYREEIAKFLNTNIVVVEHRYFLESTPKDLNWDYLTAENSAYDLHNIFTAIKPIYPKKWISTGISKGGQTSNIYRTYFPDDVDISVPYVAPLCRDVEDGRHEVFLRDSVGTASDRARIKEFQIEFLKRKDAIMPLLEDLVKEKNYTYNIPLREVFDFCVLEFPFAFWQWGMPLSILPAKSASDQAYFDCMLKVSGPDYLVNHSPISSFYVQAAREIGYYGYDTKPFKKWLDIKTAKGYLARIFLPKDYNKIRFDKTLFNKISEFIRTTDKHMLYIYGEYDPWSSPRILNQGRDNIKIFIDPKGSHKARISTFDQETQEEILGTLRGWLYN